MCGNPSTQIKFDAEPGFIDLPLDRIGKLPIDQHATDRTALVMTSSDIRATLLRA